MPESVREDAQRRRAEAREQRRSLVARPFEALDEAARTDGEPAATLRDAAKGAAAAALAGALAGVVKAVVEGRGSRDAEGQDGASPDAEQPAEPEAEHEDEAPDAEERDEPEAEHDDEAPEAESGDEPEAERDEEEPQAGHEDEEAGAGSDEERDEEPEPEREEPQAVREDDDASHEHGAEPSAQAEPGRDDDGDDADGEGELHGAPPAEAGRVAQEARRVLERLVGSTAERVLGIDRSDGGWAVWLEVLELKRVPDSTDILAAYEVVLDDDRNLVRLSRGHRYRRCHVEETV